MPVWASVLVSTRRWLLVHRHRDRMLHLSCEDEAMIEIRIFVDITSEECCQIFVGGHEVKLLDFCACGHACWKYYRSCCQCGASRRENPCEVCRVRLGA